MDREPSVDRAWRASAEVWPGAIARIVVLALLLFVPWLSATSGVAGWIWAPALVVLVCWIFTPELSSRGAVAVPTLILPVAAAALFAVFQLIPLPSSALGELSPSAQRWWGLVDLAGSEPDRTGLALSSKLSNHSVSLFPWGTKQSLAMLAFAAVFLLAGARFFRRVVPFAWLNVTIAFVIAGAVAVFGYNWLQNVSLWRIELDPVPLFLLGIAAALGLTLQRNNAGRSAVGVLALFVSVGGLALFLNQTALIVAAAGGAAVVAGLIVSLIPGRRLTIPVILVGATVAPWFVVDAGLRIPAEWQQFLRAGSGFGSASLLKTDRPPNDLSPTTFISRVMVEGGWPALVLAALAVWLFAESLARLASTGDRDARGFFAAGMFLGSTSVAWLGYSDWIAAPFYVMAFALFIGAIVGRAGLDVQSSFNSTSFALPRFLPAPTFGALLLAASLWAASVAWAAERTRSALAAATIKPSPQLKISEVDDALLRLRPLVHHGDATALYRLAECRILRFQIQTAEQTAKLLKLDPQEAMRRIDPSEIFSRANYMRRAKQSAALESLRREIPVVQNLEQAHAELRAALAASPLASEIALRAAQLRFVSDAPVNESALLQLAAERAGPYPELLYAIGLEEYAVDHFDRAAELWRNSLQLSLNKLVPITRLLSPKMRAPDLLEKVLPNHPEAYLTYAETVGGGSAMLKVTALEFAKKSLESVELPSAQRKFHQGRWHAGVNDMPKAIEAFKAALKEDPTNVRYRLALITALDLKGDRPAALEEAKRALSERPNDNDLKAAVERLQRPAPKREPPKSESSKEKTPKK
jgi:tetratricopeptide (TPR) repeat protein